MENLEDILNSIKNLEEKHKDQILFLSFAGSEIRDLEELITFGRDLLQEYDPKFYLLDDNEFKDFNQKEELSKKLLISDKSKSYFPITGNNNIHREISYPPNPYNLLGILEVGKENIKDNESLFLGHYSRRFGNILHKLILEQKYLEKDFFMNEINHLFQHDIANSLTGIVLFNKIINQRMSKIVDSSEKEVILDYARMISDNGERINELLGLVTLTNKSKYEINEKTPYYIKGKMINQISGIIGKRHYEPGIVFSLDKTLSDAKISMNRALFSSSIENLLGNSLKYTTDKGRIIMNVRLEGDYLVYENVNDVAEVLDLDKINSLKIKGNRLGLTDIPQVNHGLSQGFGLYMINRFIKLYDGSLDFESGNNFDPGNILSDQNELFHFGKLEDIITMDKYYLSRIKIPVKEIGLELK